MFELDYCGAQLDRDSYVHSFREEILLMFDLGGVTRRWPEMSACRLAHPGDHRERHDGGGSLDEMGCIWQGEVVLLQRPAERSRVR